MKFRVTIEVEDIGDHPWVDGISDKIDDWTEKLVTDRLKGLKRATKAGKEEHMKRIQREVRRLERELFRKAVFAWKFYLKTNR